VHPGDDLDQRRLAGAVVAEQTDDLPGPQREVDVVEHLDAAERLPDAAQLEPDRSGRGRLSRSLQGTENRSVGARVREFRHDLLDGTETMRPATAGGDRRPDCAPVRTG